ncbi:hypothetical protein E8Q33_11180 [Methylophaga sp. SB9B]|uniref:DUF58 domain-containing protein n=1 Tax=Methylophaga sp. SB9B TaxID=2570356 RepID=UPI0010A7F6C7|nr:hypothetical protein [Methylophaga sp. SB9B]THK40848.1 hypothetical protein E8Q33_11180 [Methylophaga sp. SB9B]
MNQRDIQHLVFDYKTPFLLNALRESEHKSKRQGPGSDFYKKSAFLADPNPARIDLASSVTDPFESIYVKTFRQRSKLDVLTFIDGSDSMTIPGKADLLNLSETSIACSVAARNDQYQSYLFSDSIHSVTNPQTLTEYFSALGNGEHHNSANAFADIDRLLPVRRSLIFLLSDFHWSNEKLHQVFNSLSGHYLVPIVIWRSAEYENFPLWRFVQLRDAETGENRLVFVTPKQKKLIESTFVDRKLFLNKLFQKYNSRAIWMIDQFSAQNMSEYFHGH